jgi:hypothetical protein
VKLIARWRRSEADSWRRASRAHVPWVGGGGLRWPQALGIPNQCQTQPRVARSRPAALSLEHPALRCPRHGSQRRFRAARCPA